MCDSAEKSCALGISAFLTRPNGNIVLFVDLGGDHEARCHRGNCRHLHNRIYTNRISGGYAGEGTYRRTGSAGHLDGFLCWRQVGYSWGKADTDQNTNATIVSFPGTVFNTITSPLAPFAGSSSPRLDGFIVGAQAGYNWQFNPRWVLGFETDIQHSAERGSGTFLDPFSTTVCTGAVFQPPGPAVCFATSPATGALAMNYTAEIDWFGTVRARLGYLVTDQLLLYATGGLAYGRVHVTAFATSAVSVLGGAPSVTTSPLGFISAKINVGWTVGGGIEGRFTYWLPPAWSWKLEYLYVDLGSLDTVIPLAGGPGFIGTFGTITTHTDFTDHIVRVGLNYKFN
jgi:outer membrane immunogenic protein